MDSSQLKNIVEAALLAAGGPLTVGQLQALFGDKDGPEKQEIRAVIKELQADYEGRGIEIREVASGFRVQVRDGMSQWLSKLWEDRPPRYSRALMETLAIVAYRQPVTRGDIEEIRGVSVTSNIIRTLLEREWIKVVGHRDVPGKPAMFGTTRDFLDYFSLKKLDDLPPLAELAELEPVGVQLQIETGEEVEGTPPTTEEHAAQAANEADQTEVGDPDGEVAGGEVAQGEVVEGEAPDAPEPTEEDSLTFDEVDEDEDEELTDEELAAAMATIEEITAEVTNKKSTTVDDESEAQDVPPGAVAPLVGLNPPGEEPPGPATISSLDEARAAAADKQDEPDGSPPQESAEQSAEVVPLKTS